ncbi:MAG: hypothetical protein QMC95_05215 [Desulfitobacteriaceae bacterium]|nr:hypothetical protein [Desulfitobacteriaceae bacterium]MDI6913601.1 hypothetical protein [Desulfitobacteriaceae bacterium]
MLQFYNPTSEVKASQYVLSQRVKELRQKTVVLFNNSKPNVDILFEHLDELISQRFGVKEILKRGKKNVALPAPEKLLQQVGKEADLVVCGVGD